MELLQQASHNALNNLFIRSTQLSSPLLHVQYESPLYEKPLDLYSLGTLAIVCGQHFSNDFYMLILDYSRQTL